MSVQLELNNLCPGLPVTWKVMYTTIEFAVLYCSSMKYLESIFICDCFSSYIMIKTYNCLLKAILTMFTCGDQVKWRSLAEKKKIVRHCSSIFFNSQSELNVFTEYILIMRFVPYLW